jgi:hypothetical protein
MIKKLLKFWAILLCLTCLITFWFAILAVRSGWTYLRLDTKGTAAVQSWDIQMISPSRYALYATYRYTVGGEEFIGQTLFSSSTYPNYYAAELDLKTRAAQRMHVWYDQRYFDLRRPPLFLFCTHPLIE